jgi:hypothetical protein
MDAPRPDKSTGETTMRFMSVIYADESQGAPPQALMDAMGDLIERWTKSGRLVDTGGLAPKAETARVRLAGNRISVLDGPFSEAKEMIGGYAILECASKEEAVQATNEFVQLHLDHWPGCEVECEVRQIFGPND